MHRPRFSLSPVRDEWADAACPPSFDSSFCLSEVSRNFFPAHQPWCGLPLIGFFDPGWRNGIVLTLFTAIDPICRYCDTTCPLAFESLEPMIARRSESRNIRNFLTNNCPVGMLIPNRHVCEMRSNGDFAQGSLKYFAIRRNLRMSVIAFNISGSARPGDGPDHAGIVNKALAVGTVGYGVIEASDGNFYAMSLPKSQPKYIAPIIRICIARTYTRSPRRHPLKIPLLPGCQLKRARVPQTLTVWNQRP